MTALPLAGYRVLDLSRALAGPFCAMTLGDLGADVAKVEPTPSGEMIRSWGPFDHDISVYFLSVNRNKRSLALNFRDPVAIHLIRRMADTADVLIENFKPGTMEKMGLDYNDLRKSNPKLVYANVTGFGRDGPYGDWPGVDQIAQGMSGLMSVTGARDGEPTRVGVPIGDLVAGMWTAIGVQAALLAREKSGTGQRVETSLLASLVGMLCLQGQRYLSLGEVPRMAGNDHPLVWPYGTFEAKDGPFNMAATSDEMWKSLCKLLGLEHIAEHPDFKDNTARAHNRDEVRRILNERFASRTRMDWTRDLVKLGLPAGPIYDMADVFADPQVLQQGMTETIEHPLLGPLRQLANPIKMESLEGRSVRRPPPILGEHSEAILRDYHLEASEIVKLIEAGTVMSEKETTGAA
jgi:crotonobetainyl-CoA:carnitine CoA-transferase CaiB-like acyl-CoA transferase